MIELVVPQLMFYVDLTSPLCGSRRVECVSNARPFFEVTSVPSFFGVSARVSVLHKSHAVCALCV